MDKLPILKKIDINYCKVKKEVLLYNYTKERDKKYKR